MPVPLESERARAGTSSLEVCHFSQRLKKRSARGILQPMNHQQPRPTETHHPAYHLHQLLTQLVQRCSRPEPAHTTRALALVELLQPARHTLTQLWSLLGLHTFPARAYRLFQRYSTRKPPFACSLSRTLRPCPPMYRCWSSWTPPKCPARASECQESHCCARAIPSRVPKACTAPSVGCPCSGCPPRNTAVGARCAWGLLPPFAPSPRRRLRGVGHWRWRARGRWGISGERGWTRRGEPRGGWWCWGMGHIVRGRLCSTCPRARGRLGCCTQTRG